MRASRIAVAALSLVAATISTVAPSGAQGRPDAPGSPADYWTAERRAAAIPRDLVIDEHGNGYLRRPDGTLEPYGSPAGNQLRATDPAPAGKPGGGGGTTDTTGPSITKVDPLAGATIGTSHTFKASVTDASGVRSVSFVIVYPNGTTTQSFAASTTDGTNYAVALQGFSAGDWSWYVVAKDAAGRGGNTSTSTTTGFTVAADGGGGGGGGGGGTGDVVTNAPWTAGGDVQSAAGRIYFEMPANPNGTRWNGYVCSGTTVTDGTTGRSIILTAAHCVYDDEHKTFARNVLFIPDQDGTSGSGTDLNCSNDPHGCWAPSFGVVDSDWSSRTWPANIAWDYAYYVVNDSGAHSGTGTNTVLDSVGSLAVSFGAPSPGSDTAALGYSYSEDPNFMHCREGLGTDGSTNWFLPSCELSGGASGGPWLQPVSEGNGTVMSVNSYGYTTKPGMGGPMLNGTSASCLFSEAKITNASVAFDC